MRGEHAGLVMPVASRRGNQCGEQVEQLERGQGELGLAGERGGRRPAPDHLPIERIEIDLPE